MKLRIRKAALSRALAVLLSLSMAGSMLAACGITAAAAVTNNYAQLFTSVTASSACVSGTDVVNQTETITSYYDDGTVYSGYNLPKTVAASTTGDAFTSSNSVSVPVTATFKVNASSVTQVFLDAKSADSTDAKPVLNRDHIHLYEAVRNPDGTYAKSTQIPDPELNIYNTNYWDPTANYGKGRFQGRDTYFNLSMNGGVKYDTTYMIVIDQLFSIVQSTGAIKWYLPCEVDIPFTTGSRPAVPSVDSAMITGGTGLQLTGLTMSSNLEYNLALDGVNYTGWFPFTYSDTSANIALPSAVAPSTDAKLKVAYVPSSGVVPTAVSEPVSIAFKQSIPTFSDAIINTGGTVLTLEGLPENAANLEFDVAADGKTFTGTWKPLSVTDTTAVISGVSGLTVGTTVVRVRVAADALTTVASDPVNCTVIIARPSSYTSPPSVSTAQLNGNALTIYGLPVTTVSLEYSIAPDGTTYGNWTTLLYSGSKAVVDVTGLSVGAASAVQIRYAADNTHQPSNEATVSVSYAINATIPLTQGQTVSVAGSSVVINPEALASGTNTVSVRNATGQLLKTPYTNLGFYGPEEELVPLCGGTYGFAFNQAGDASADSMQITIPYTLPESTEITMQNGTTLTDSKVAIYMLLPYARDGSQGYQYWQYLPTIIDPVNHTAAITLSGDMTGQDVILSVRYDVCSDSGWDVSFASYQPDTSITLCVGCFDWSGVSSITLYRVEEQDTSKAKEITIDCKDMNMVRNHPGDTGGSLYYTDTDVSPGVDYFYTVKSYTDNLGNISNWVSGGSYYAIAYCDSEQSEAEREEASILMNLANPPAADTKYINLTSVFYSDTFIKQIEDGYQFNTPHFSFADGDSQSSVTTDFCLPGGVYVTSSNTNAVSIGNMTFYNPPTKSNITGTMTDLTKVTPQVDKDGNPVDTTVTLTLTITKGFSEMDYKNSGGWIIHDPRIVTFTVPVTVKWKQTGSAVELNTLGNLGYYVEIGQYDGDGSGVPSYFLEHNGLDKLINAAQLGSGIDTIVLDDSLNVDKEEGYYIDNTTGEVDNSPLALYSPGRHTDSYVGGNFRKVTVDGKGKTLKANFDGSLINLICGYSYNGSSGTLFKDDIGEITLENFTIDLNGHNCSVFNNEGNASFGSITLKNCNVIGGQNSNYGIAASSCMQNDGSIPDQISITLDSCTFGAFKIAAVAAVNDGANHLYYNPNGISSVSQNIPADIHIANCTFDGGNIPGYGIVDQFGKVTATDCTFKNYTGAVSTGWTGSTDGYIEKDGFVYKGIPNGSASAGILADAWGNVTLSGCTFSGNDRSVWIRTNENSVSRLSYLKCYYVNTDQANNVLIYTADYQGIAYTTLNGITVKDTDTAAAAIANLQGSNTFSAGTSGVKNTLTAEDASSPYAAKVLASVVPTVYKLGDINDDGEVNSKDVTILRRYLAGWPNITIDATAADVNKDGAVNSKDSTILRRYAAGWNVGLK